MRKLFLLISVLTLSIAVNATTHEIGSGTSNILGTTVASAADGDIIILTDNGPYVNVKGVDYTRLNKNLTIQAAENKTPVIQYEVPFRSTDGKTVKFIGITFDGTSLTEYDWYFRFYDANNNNLEFEDCEFRNVSTYYVFDVYTACKANSLKLTNCKLHDNSKRGIYNRGTLTSLEINGGQIYNFTGASVLENTDGATLGKVKINGTEFYGNKKDIIYGTATSQADSCIINNCYFHDNDYSAIYFNKSTVESQQTILGLKVTNSTFANNDPSKEYRSVIDVQSYNREATDAIEVVLDHCTFYNNTAINYDYSAIRTRIANRTTVSNCIFAHPSAIEFYATNVHAGSVTNCLAYNFNKGYSAPTKTNANTGDPLFTDAAEGDFSYAGNWSTGSISPARGAATDGSDLGDPRWYTDETIPSTSFASAYDLLGTKAQLKGNIELNASDHIKYTGSQVAGTAKWKLHVGRKCKISAVADREAESTSGCTLTLTIYDADGDEVSTISAARSDNDNDINFPGTLNIPEEGDYTIVLTNSVEYSGAILEKITLSYYGGAVQNISTSTTTSLNVADAWFSGCTRDNDKTYIQYPSSETSSAWIKWNIATSETKYYDLTVNVNTEYAHGFTAAIYEDEEVAPVASVTEGSYINTQGILALELGRVNLVGGKNYVVKVTNSPSGSQAKVTSVVFAPVVATATTLPNTLAFSNAVLSEKAFIQDDMLYFNEIGDTDPRGEWAQWEVTTDHDGLFLFTMGVTSTNGQNYKITIKDDGDNELDYYETSLSSGDKTVKHYFALATGNYFVKVENTRSYSKGHLTSLVVTEPAGVVTLDEAATSNESWVEKVVDKEAAGPLYDVQIKRTIKAGMYNTFCLPFAVSPDMCKDIFGSDVQIRTLDSATVDEDFVLTLDFKKSSDIYPGTPVLIQTSRDIVNPVFIGVKFTRETPSATTKTNANFYGTFVKTALEVNENILFLGANNKLYFPTASVDIYGMRGWFVIHGVSASAIKRARIVENNNAPTDIEIIGSQKKVESQKLIENGQLVIIRDGIRYNVMGARVK